jgi:hypothetical protein
MSGRTRAAAVAAAILAGAVMGWASPARSAVLEHGRFSHSHSDDFVFCGIPVHYEAEHRGLFNTRIGKGELDTFFFKHLVEKSDETFTNPANGKFFTTSGQWVEHDVQARRVEGSIFQVTTNEAGMPLVLRDLNGQVVLRDRGVISTTILFDTGGDHVPGGDTVEVLDVRVAGPHPDFFMQDAERCALIQRLIG